MPYTIVLEQEKDGSFVASVPALPGCVSQGGTRAEALDNIRAAIELYIEDCREAGDPVPTEAKKAVDRGHLKRKDKIAFLIQKYSVLRDESRAYVSLYKSQVKYMQFVVTAVIAALSVDLKYLSITTELLFWISILATTIISYIAFDSMDSMYNIMVIGSRLSVLEEQINGLAREKILIFETLISKYHSRIKVGSVLDPSAFSLGYAFVLICLGILAIPLYVTFWASTKMNPLFTGLILLYSVTSIVFMIYSAVAIGRKLHVEARRAALDLLNSASS